MNQAQKITLETYSNGAFAWLADTNGNAKNILDRYTGEHDPVEEYLAAEGGDTLVTFLYRELANDGDIMNKDEVLRRIDVAIDDINGVRQALENRLTD
jgi:hypothetical protein